MASGLDGLDYRHLEKKNNMKILVEIDVNSFQNHLIPFVLCI